VEILVDVVAVPTGLTELLPKRVVQTTLVEVCAKATAAAASCKATTHEAWKYMTMNYGSMERLYDRIWIRANLQTWLQMKRQPVTRMLED